MNEAKGQTAVLNGCSRSRIQLAAPFQSGSILFWPAEDTDRWRTDSRVVNFACGLVRAGDSKVPQIYSIIIGFPAA